MNLHVLKLFPANESINNRVDIKRIAFSKNEKFIVLMSTTHALVCALINGKLEKKAFIQLPETTDYSKAEQDKLRDLAKFHQRGTYIDRIAEGEISTVAVDLKPMDGGDSYEFRKLSAEKASSIHLRNPDQSKMSVGSQNSATVTDVGEESQNVSLDDVHIP